MVKRWLRNLVYEWVFLAIIIALYVPARNQDCFFGINGLVKAAMVIKGGIVIPICIILSLLSYKGYLKSSQLEIIGSVLAIPSSAWFWYVCSSYFSPINNWKEKSKNLFYIHSLLAIEALWFFFKLFLIVLLLSIIIIAVWCDSYVQGRRKRNRNLGIKDKIMGRDSLNLSTSKIDSEEFWIICMEVYKPGDKIVRLPCDSKHFFHSACIGEWIEVSPKCPLCNTELDSSISSAA